MCGIVAYAGGMDCGAVLLDGLARLEYRGYDSAGIALHDGKVVRRLRAEGKLLHLQQRFQNEPLRGSLGIGHTRWATHGKPVERNAHPHLYEGVVVVHNGIIENYLELRAMLAAEGHEFSSETDTETIAHLVVRARRNGLDLRDAVRAALEEVRGSWAVVVMAEDEPDRLIAARNASPLVLGLGDRENFVASDVPAILQHTRDMVFLEDGDLVELRRESATIFDGRGQEVERPVKTISWDPVSAEKQGYKHFMLKEIHEQPDRLIDTLRGRLSPDRRHVTLRELAPFDEDRASVQRILLLACGTSWHAGMVGRYTIEALARVPVDVELASEFRYRDAVLAPNTWVIAISQSGETADTIAAIQEASRLGARTLTICNVMESTLTRITEATLYTQAGPEIGVASTKAFTTQLAALYLLGLWLAEGRQTIQGDEAAAHLEALVQIPAQMREILDDESDIMERSRPYQGARSMLFLGRGNHFPIALEGALKLKEISYIHAEGYAAGEMKHGPIALIDEDLPVVVLAPSGASLEKTFSNMEEVRARGGQVIAVTCREEVDVQEAADTSFLVPKTLDVFQPLLSVLPLQLFSYAIADARGTDVDQPRNLAKSVTVE